MSRRLLPVACCLFLASSGCFRTQKASDLPGSLTPCEPSGSAGAHLGVGGQHLLAHLLRACSLSRCASSASESARIAAARSAGVGARRRWPPSPPAGRAASAPSTAANRARRACPPTSGTPITGSVVCATIAPARCAASPAPAMSTLMPCPRRRARSRPPLRACDAPTARAAPLSTPSSSSASLASSIVVEVAVRAHQDADLSAHASSCLAADVAAIMCTCQSEFVRLHHKRARAPRRGSSPTRGHAEDAPAGGDDAIAVAPRAGVEHHRRPRRARGVEPVDRLAALVGAGIAARRHARRTPRARSEKRTRATGARRSAVGVQAARPRSSSSRTISACVSGSPKRQLNSSTSRPLRRQHQPGVEQPAKRPPLGGHARAPSARAPRAPRAPPSTSLITGVGETAPMPPVIGPSSPSWTVLWSSAGASGVTLLAVDERHQRRLAPDEELLDHHAPPGVAEARSPTSIARTLALGLGRAARDDHALAGGQPVGLDDQRARRRSRTAASMNSSASGSLRERAERRGRHPWRAISSLANAFEPSISAAAREQPNTARPRSRSRSASPATSGASGPTTDEIDASRASASSASLTDLVGPDRHAARDRCDARVARRAQHLAHRRRSRQRPGQRVLAPAAADDEHLHLENAACSSAGSGASW